MKYCDSCRSSYPGDFTTCPKDQSTLRSITELMAGLVLRGKYEILERIGAGGMGAVYKARHVAFGEIRAIKFIGSHLTGDEEFLARFRGEAVLARKLQHPNIVRVEDIDATEDGRPFIVMEHVEGKSLRSVLRKEHALHPSRAVEVARQILAALSAAHALGILHRDIKPENIVLVRSSGAERTEIVKVLDFGLAKVLEGFEGAGDQVSTQTGMLVGTPQYISPEQAMPTKGLELDGRVDLYSLGIVLYELLTGHLPFQADTPVAMVLHHIQTRPEAPHVAFPDRGITAPLSALVMRALEKNRTARFATADEMGQALAEVAANLPPAPPVVADGPDAEDALLPDTVVRTARAAPTDAPTPATVLVTRGPATPSPAVARRPASASSAARRATRPVFHKPQPDPPEGRRGLTLVLLVVAAAVGIGYAWTRSTAPPDTAPPATEATDTSPEGAVVVAEPEAPGDNEIRSEVQRLLASSDALAEAQLQVAVANGIVTVSGEAPSATTRALALSLAGSAPGVKKVFNLVQITPASASSTPVPVATALPAETPPPTLAAAPQTPPPPPAEPSRGGEVRELLEKARRQIDSGDHDGAEKTFEAVLRLDPNNAIAKDALERRRSHPPPPQRPPGQPPPPSS